jgi:mRNA interferase MazF
MQRGDVWWAALPEPAGSGPGYRRPVLVVQADDFNRSRIGTVVVAVLTSNVTLAQAPGNVLAGARRTGLPRDSVVNVSQLLTVDKRLLTKKARALDPATMAEVNDTLAEARHGEHAAKSVCSVARLVVQCLALARRAQNRINRGA